MLLFSSATFYIFRNLSWFRLFLACPGRVLVPVYEWRRHSSFYFQPGPAVVSNDIHDGRGHACFGAVFPLSQLGHGDPFFSSLHTRKARPQSLHSYSLPGIFSHLPGHVLDRSIIIPYLLSAAREVTEQSVAYRNSTECGSSGRLRETMKPSGDGRSCCRICTDYPATPGHPPFRDCPHSPLAQRREC